MKKKNGFTLVELLAVIVILGVVMLIGTVSLTSIKRRMERNMFEEKLATIINSARTYGADYNLNNNNGTYVTVGDLIDNNYLETDETCNDNKCIAHYYDKASMNELKVQTYKTYNRVYACIPLNETNNNILFKEDGITKDDFSNQDLFCD